MSYCNMMRQISNHKFFIRENEQNYYASMKVDKAKFEEENIFKLERRKVVEEMEVRRKLSEEREKRKKEEEALALERRAQIEMQIAGQLMESVKLQRKEMEDKGTRSKKQSKMLKAKMDEESGNNLHNFKLGTDDLETTYQFHDTPLFPNEPKSNPPRKAKDKVKGTGNGVAQAGEKKRLKKKLYDPNLKDVDSDEMLDLVIEDDNYGPDKGGKRNRLNPVGGNDEEDSDLGDKMANDDDIAVPEVNFGGQDGEENTL